MKGYTFYSKNAGVEVRGTTAVKEAEGNISKEGRVTMRFFTLGDNTKSFRFVMRPDEAFAIGTKALLCSETGKTQPVTHRYEGEEATIETKVAFERYELKKESSNGAVRYGYAAMLQRGDDKVNVSMTQDSMVYMGELLKALSIEQAWRSFKGPDGEEKTDDAENTTETETPVVEVEGPVKAPEPEKVAEPAKSETANHAAEDNGLKRVRNLSIARLTKTGLPVVIVGDTEVFASKSTNVLGNLEIKVGQIVDVVLSGNGKYIEEICAAA